MNIVNALRRASAPGLGIMVLVAYALTHVAVAQAGVVRYSIAGDFFANVGSFPYPYAGAFLGEFSMDKDVRIGDEGNLLRWSIHVTDDPMSTLTALHFDSSLPNAVGRWRHDGGTSYDFVIGNGDPSDRGFGFRIVFDDSYYGDNYFSGGLDEAPFLGSTYSDPSPLSVSRYVGSSRVWVVSEPTSIALLCVAGLASWQAQRVRPRAPP